MQVQKNQMTYWKRNINIIYILKLGLPFPHTHTLDDNQERDIGNQKKSIKTNLNKRPIPLYIQTDVWSPV